MHADKEKTQLSVYILPYIYMKWDILEVKYHFRLLNLSQK